MQNLYPLHFEPIYRDAIWGGGRIGKKFRRLSISSHTAESWEISDRMQAESRVSEGSLKGKTLHELIEQFGEDLLGHGRKDLRFPLLIKIIDAGEALSVQVHPSEEIAALCHGEPKNEMWYMLEGGPVYAGFKKTVRPDEWSKAVQSNQVVDLLQKFSAKPGDAVFIPGGRVHAIGKGCMMLEVQQNSDTTYRIYDWNRVGLDGKRRPLHLEAAMKCVKWDDDNDPIRASQIIEESGDFKRWKILSTLFFTIEKWEISSQFRVNPDPKTFQIFFYLSGSQKGRTMLLPARSEPLNLSGPLSLVRIFMEEVTTTR
jgi:mannose-6-phosphate isomerase